MKSFARICTGMAIAAGLFATCAARAQVISIADEIRPDEEGAYYGGYRRLPPGPPAADADDIMPPPEVISLLRADGYAPIGPALRRGWVYTVAVVTPDGDDGRLVVDARTGDPIRFIPAMRIDSRLNEELDFMYGPPGPPSNAFAQDIYTRRTAPRPPASVPKAAARPPLPHAPKAAAAEPKPANPSAPAKPDIARSDANKPETARVDAAKTEAPKSEPVTNGTAPPQTARSEAVKSEDAKPEAKPDETGTVQASTTGQATSAKSEPSRPAEAKPADAKPGEVHLKPTEPMPPVQTFE